MHHHTENEERAINLLNLVIFPVLRQIEPQVGWCCCLVGCVSLSLSSSLSCVCVWLWLCVVVVVVVAVAVTVVWCGCGCDCGVVRGLTR